MLVGLCGWCRLNKWVQFCRTTVAWQSKRSAFVRSSVEWELHTVPTYTWYKYKRMATVGESPPGVLHRQPEIVQSGWAIEGCHSSSVRVVVTGCAFNIRSTNTTTTSEYWRGWAMVSRTIRVNEKRTIRIQSPLKASEWFSEKHTNQQHQKQQFWALGVRCGCQISIREL